MRSLFPDRGAAGAPLMFVIERPLVASDLWRLATEPAVRTAPPILQRLSAKHHRAARLLATGRSTVDVGLVCDYTPQRLRDLQRDPSFQELMAYYTGNLEDGELEDGQRLRTKILENAELATNEISNRLEDPAAVKEIPISELRQIAAHGLDRTVAPPKVADTSKAVPTQITFNIAGRGLNPVKPGDDAVDVTPHDNVSRGALLGETGEC